MAASQEKIRKIVPGFKWVLGFSGGSFQAGNPEEAKGDQRMLGESSNLILIVIIYWYGEVFFHLPFITLKVSPAISLSDFYFVYYYK